jgi:leucyl/phenylalanyl-tRNA---protein transferase
MTVLFRDPLPILQRYAAGWFPMVDAFEPGRAVFYWDRCPMRAILPVDAQAAARARRMARRFAGRFSIRYNTSLETILRHLGRVKEHSWVKGPVLEIYRALDAAHVLHTVEAWTVPGSPRHENRVSKREKSSRSRLVGALLGIRLPGVFVGETMYGLVPDASKVCLCQLVQDCHAAGMDFIDVQTPHDAGSCADDLGEDSPASHGGKTNTPHPCIRLGEEHIPHAEFLGRLHTSLARHAPGSGVRSVGDILRAWLIHTAEDSSEPFRSSCVQIRHGPA